MMRRHTYIVAHRYVSVAKTCMYILEIVVSINTNVRTHSKQKTEREMIERGKNSVDGVHVVH